MIGKALWENLKVLVDCDKQIVTLKKTIQEAHQALKHNQQLMARLQTSLEEKKQRYLTQKKNVALQELTAQELKENLEAKKEQFSNMHHLKEYKALEKEALYLSQQSQEQEDILIKAWSNLETITKQVDDETKQTQERATLLAEENKQKEEFISQLQEKLQALLKQRENMLPLIPEDWLTRYERMKHTIQDPIVPVVQISCGACYYSVLHQDLHKLKKSGVLPCRNCYRFLYYEEEEEGKTNHSTTA